jgi:hypothetical protein
VTNEPQFTAFNLIFSSTLPTTYAKLGGFNLIYSATTIDNSIPKLQALTFTLVPPTTLKSASINSQTSLL